MAAPAQSAQYPLMPEALPQPGVPQHEGMGFVFNHSKIYPGTTRRYWVTVPADYTPDKPACVLIDFDGVQFRADTVIDNLIHTKEIPVIIGVFVEWGAVPDNAPGLPDADQPQPPQPPGGEPPKMSDRFNRDYEFDSTNSNLTRFILDELLPEVETKTTRDGRPIHLSHDGKDRMVMGVSSGGVAAFTCAWQRPDQFSRVYTVIGTYVGMRGAEEYPTLIRKTEPKPFRIYLQDNDKDIWNPLFGNWFMNDESMEAALTFAGYEVNHSWGIGGHDGNQGTSIFPNVMRWLWKDYPAAPAKGVSKNDALVAALDPSSDWTPVPNAPANATGLATSPQGEIAISAGATISRLANGQVTQMESNAPIDSTMAFSADGRLFVADRAQKTITSSAGNSSPAFSFSGLSAQGMTVTPGGDLYVTETGDGESGNLWLIKSNGTKTKLDTGLHFPTGVTLSLDHKVLFVAEGHTHYVYSYFVQSDGNLIYKQRYDWLHTAESADDAGDFADARDIVPDNAGNLYVATRMGVQICDNNGRVRGILTLPSGAVTSLAFGGPQFDTLYIISGGTVYSRKMKVQGYPSFLPPGPYKSAGFGSLPPRGRAGTLAAN